MPSGISVGSPLVLGPQLLSTFRRFSLRTLERPPQPAETLGMERRFLPGSPGACQNDLGTPATRGHSTRGASSERQAWETKGRVGAFDIVPEVYRTPSAMREANLTSAV
jgi:hypothetical protein